LKPLIPLSIKLLANVVGDIIIGPERGPNKTFHKAATITVNSYAGC
jgi:hypothetical protein